MATVSFAQALEAGDLSAVRSAPKADYHCHCYYGTRIENIERWLGRSLERPIVPLRGLQGMRDYAARAIDPYVNSRAGFEFTADAALEDAAGDGVRRLEMSFDVRGAAQYGRPHDLRPERLAGVPEPVQRRRFLSRRA